MSAPAATRVDPITASLVRNSRAMIDVDYAGSPLIADHGSGGATAGPRPGQWYPDWRTICVNSPGVISTGFTGSS